MLKDGAHVVKKIATPVAHVAGKAAMGLGRRAVGLGKAIYEAQQAHKEREKERKANKRPTTFQQYRQQRIHDSAVRSMQRKRRKKDFKENHPYLKKVVKFTCGLAAAALVASLLSKASAKEAPRLTLVKGRPVKPQHSVSLDSKFLESNQSLIADDATLSSSQREVLDRMASRVTMAVMNQGDSRWIR